MVKASTWGVTITVESYYQEDYSSPKDHEFMFAYRITIENHNPFTVKLLSRHWDIMDSTGEVRTVEGEGVVGVLPLISEDYKYEYISGCNLHSDIGKMEGWYIMENAATHEQFQVRIPGFVMIVPFKNN